MDIQINEKLVKYNFSSREGVSIKYIVIHDTGNESKGANANAHFLYFNSGDKQSSAHYFVDDTQILRIIKDEDKSWAVGDGRGKYGITNANSLSIEMCINSDGDFSKTYIKTLNLTKYLMEKYKISIDNVVRHYDASLKSCPHIWDKNNWEKWYVFKEDLKKMTANTVDYKNLLNLLYKNILGREGDSEGINYWNNKLNSGYTVGDFLKLLSEGKEFKNKYNI